MKGGRRWFLKTLGAGGAQLAAGAIGLGARSQPAWACPSIPSDCWGALQTPYSPTSWPGHANLDGPGYKILEIFLRGGASQWETFWLPGATTNATMPDFSAYEMGELELHRLQWGTSRFPCNEPDTPDDHDDAAFFATQSDNSRIYWGASAKPLYNRPDIRARTRMITQYHDLSPHEAAVPYALCGLRLGAPNRAGTGAAIQRHAMALNPGQVIPVSYIMDVSSPSASNAASATGQHPGFARPLVIHMRRDNRFYDTLSRTNITAESDELLLALRHAYRDRMRFQNSGGPVRSAGYDAYWAAVELLKSAPDLQALFTDNLLVIKPAEIDQCSQFPNARRDHYPGAKTMLNAAASLLADGPARYVCVIDRGIAGGYDTHGSSSLNHLQYTTSSLYNVLYHLAHIIKDANNPAGDPSAKLDLDKTMVVINTEFGRTPFVNDNKGRDHWPMGYATILIGGPITGGPSILGRIDSDGYTDILHRYSPTDIRGAILLAAGVDPLADDNFSTSDFSSALTNNSYGHNHLRNRLKGEILDV